MGQRVLLIGSGGREHALAWKLAQSPHLGELLLAPGNAGMQALGRTLGNLNVLDAAAVAACAVQERIDLVVVGPEAPLAAGVADALIRRGIPTYGPSRAAAELEASKAAAKSFMRRYGIPTAEAVTVHNLDAATRAIHALSERNNGRVVVKESGLAAGKGVTVAQDVGEAIAAARNAFTRGLDKLVVEEFLHGREASLLVLCNENSAIALPLVEDHKTLFDGDVGPMTGGMGTVAPAHTLTPDAVEAVMATMVRPTLAALAQEGRPFVGTLFLGLMLTSDGPRLLEYNVRFGDPETQALMRLFDDDLLEVLGALAKGEAWTRPLRWRAGVAVCVVMAAAGYPNAPVLDVPIDLTQATGTEIEIFHAGTRMDTQGRVLSAGGRVLGVTAWAAGVNEARQAAYAAVARIGFPGAQTRGDIGTRSVTFG